MGLTRLSLQDKHMAACLLKRLAMIANCWLCLCLTALSAAAQDWVKGVGAESLVTDEPLLPKEQLVPVFANTTDEHGVTTEVMVLLSRMQRGGWQAIGTSQDENLFEHWRTVARRVYADFEATELSAEERRKFDLAIDLRIAQFVRLYRGVRAKLQDGSGTSREQLSDEIHHLTTLGNQGLFRQDSLPTRILENLVASRSAKSEQAVSE